MIKAQEPPPPKGVPDVVDRPPPDIRPVPPPDVHPVPPPDVTPEPLPNTHQPVPPRVA